MRGDPGAVTRTAFYFQRAANLLHSFPHAEDAEVSDGCEACTRGFKSATVVLDIKLDPA